MKRYVTIFLLTAALFAGVGQVVAAQAAPSEPVAPALAEATVPDLAEVAIVFLAVERDTTAENALSLSSAPALDRRDAWEVHPPGWRLALAWERSTPGWSSGEGPMLRATGPPGVG